MKIRQARDNLNGTVRRWGNKAYTKEIGDEIEGIRIGLGDMLAGGPSALIAGGIVGAAAAGTAATALVTLGGPDMPWTYDALVSLPTSIPASAVGGIGGAVMNGLCYTFGKYDGAPERQ